MRNLIILIAMFLLSSCASTYPCGKSSTGKCRSVSDNYKDSYQNNVNPEDMEKHGLFGSSKSSTPRISMKFRGYPQIPADGAPLISDPKMLRVWLTPYTDSDNIFHDQSYEYIIVKQSDWVFDNNKNNNHIDKKNVVLIQSKNHLDNKEENNTEILQEPAEMNPEQYLQDNSTLMNVLKNNSISIKN